MENRVSWHYVLFVYYATALSKKIHSKINQICLKARVFLKQSIHFLCSPTFSYHQVLNNLYVTTKPPPISHTNNTVTYTTQYLH